LSERHYNYRPDMPDHRDFSYGDNVRKFRSNTLPFHASVLRKGPKPVDQGNLGSCTANAVGAAVFYDLMNDVSFDAFPPSRLFIYYQERAAQGTIAYDRGSSLRAGMKVISKFGAPHEDLWPYDISKFTDKPPSPAYADGQRYLASNYFRIDNTNLDDLKDCIAQGFPFVFGFSVYSSFEKIGADGVMPMPGPNEQMLGGHAVMAGAYNDHKKAFRIRNSWGRDWGRHGDFFMPYEFITDPQYATDFWTLRKID